MTHKENRHARPTPNPAKTGGGHDALVVFGPTASGKSSLAVDVATAFDGTVINADSLQVYKELRILTARPSRAEEARAPHRLYGILPGHEGCSAGRWLDMASREILETLRGRRLPILVGGTGMYLQALIEGLSPMPAISPEIRAQALERHARLGGAAFHAEVAGFDDVSAGKIPPGDTQRLVRAWEIYRQTGRTFSQWRAEPRRRASGLETVRFHVLALAPERAVLYAGIDRRFDAMLTQGAIEEVRALNALGYDSAAAVMKAVGVRQIMAYLQGRSSLDEAAFEAKTLSRRYAKRQLTWLRGQFNTAYRIDAQYSESITPEIFSFIRQFLLTR